MKKVGDNLYSDIVLFSKKIYNAKDQKLLRRAVEEDDRIIELLNSGMLLGESWFTKDIKINELRIGGMIRTSTIQLSNEAIRIKSIEYTENENKFGYIVTFSIIDTLKEFLEKEILDLNYYLSPRLLTLKISPEVKKYKLVTFDLIGGTRDRYHKEEQ